jgi:hypothetical protein
MAFRQHPLMTFSPLLLSPAGCAGSVSRHARHPESLQPSILYALQHCRGCTCLSLQGAPAVSRAMQGILNRCQQAIGGWVGSSVVHLGDHNVPNALFFLNKYTQVGGVLPRFTACQYGAFLFCNCARTKGSQQLFLCNKKLQGKGG